ncbi:MAG: winged helix-turn-helix transcriptional regulator [Clostridia bacterium]|nr:winged helix-turn-helix transcriptional regulator [Clostridia bacterium]
MKKRFENFTVLITKINRSIHKIKTEEMAEFDLKSPHVSCLYYLYKADSLTAKELGDICAEDKAALSRSIEYLESNGFIECSSNAKKRYKAALMLTEKGKQIAKCIAQKIDNILEKAGASITEENRKILYQSLEIINENLQKICNKYGE